MIGNATVIWIVAGLFLIVAIIATIVWWSLADRIYPGASDSTGQYIDVGGRDSAKRRSHSSGDAPVIIGDAGEPAHTDHTHDASGHDAGGHDAGGHDAGGGGGDAGGADGGGSH